MTSVLLDGAPVAPAILGTNDGLNYGRFDAPGLELHGYALAIDAPQLLRAFSGPFEALVAEMREDDLLDEEPSALSRMGYPTLANALHHPRELEEVIGAFLDREILRRFLPFTEASEFVINSTETISVTATGLTISGRGFRRRRP